MDFSTILELIISAVGGGGLVALFTIPEIKNGKKLDNADRLISKYDDIIKRLEKDNREKEQKINTLSSQVMALQSEVNELRTKLATVKLIHKEDELLRCTKINCGIRYPKISKEDKEQLLAQSNGKD